MSQPHRIIPIVAATPAAAAGPQVVSMYQARAAIHPRSVHGWFATWRRVLVWFTQAVFYGLPWLRWNGRQAVLFDLDAQRFHLFGLLLYPQDLIYLAVLLVLSALALFFVTAVAGRLWCGYACPQTVYTELFLWVEHRIEGDRRARLRLDKAPWSGAKVLRRGGKHAAWLAIALAIGFSFVGYFTPIRELAVATAALEMSGWHAFWVLFYAGATYGNAGFLREQMCKYICPYARFQSALIDKDSLIITYDAARGDPRGARSRKAASAAGQGDCVDCTLCVQVCPTGIDIRNGLQNECIGCAACIDACNGVMDRLGTARGLIRYATENGMANRWTDGQMLRRVLRPRVLVYGALLAGAAAAFAASVALRSPFRFDVVKDRGTLARVVEDGAVENVYRLQLMNRTESAQTYRVAAIGIDGLELAAQAAHAGPAEAVSLTARLRLPAGQAGVLAGQTRPVVFVVEATLVDGSGHGGTATQREPSTFVVPR